MTKLRLAAVLLFFGAGLQANAANISATVDRNVVGINESFQLTLEADGNTGEPDFSPLHKDFEVLDQAHSKNLAIINGQTSRQFVWDLVLMPTKTGNLQIPPISFGSDESQAINITVKQKVDKNGDESGMQLDVEVDTEQPYVQQQVIFTIRLFLRQGEVSSATLSELKVEGIDAIVERLGEDKDYQEMRDGLRWRVVERKYVVWPQQSGRMTMRPIEFSGYVRARSSIHGFDIFRQTPSRRFVLRSESVTLPVREPPASFGSEWLPAKALTITESWPEQKEIAVGEPITRNITIMADGLTAAQLPELSTKLPDGLRAYPEQPKMEDRGNANGVVGTRIETTAIIPTQPGTLILPEVQLPWWNVDKQQPELATVPARTLEVSAATATPADYAQTPTTPMDITEEQLVKADSSDALGVESVRFESHIWWPWVSLGFALMWLVTVAVWMIDRQKTRARTNKKEGSRSRIAPKQALAELNKACHAKNAAAARDALLKWAAALWPETPPRNLGQLAARCDNPLSQSIRSLEQVLYAHKTDWDNQLLPKQASAFTPPEYGSDSKRMPTLEPMYRT